MKLSTILGAAVISGTTSAIACAPRASNESSTVQSHIDSKATRQTTVVLREFSADSTIVDTLDPKNPEAQKPAVMYQGVFTTYTTNHGTKVIIKPEVIVGIEVYATIARVDSTRSDTAHVEK